MPYYEKYGFVIWVRVIIRGARRRGFTGLHGELRYVKTDALSVDFL